MKRVWVMLIAVAAISCVKDKSAVEEEVPQKVAATPDHIVFVWLENKGYSKIIGSASAPYINSLVSEGTLFSNFHALGHPSYPEYLRFFSGSPNNKNNDDCIHGKPLNNSNLYTALSAAGKSFAWYSEDLPRSGSDTCKNGKYVERHNPTQCFANVAASANKTWNDFPKDFSRLENVVCISPNLNNDMHDGSIAQGDTYVKQNCGSLVSWCKEHNSVFVIYFDEDDGSGDNRIPVIAVGQNIKAGYKSSVYYDHYNWTHTILELNGAAQIGEANAREKISDCWK